MNWNLPNKNRVNALVAVAHPDDEIIFCGGTILTHPNWNWTIVTFTGLENSERVCQYQNAMEHLILSGVNINKYLSLSQIDSGNDLSKLESQKWKNAIQELKFSPDIIFTHNTEGEYGHTHHKSVNLIINDLFDNVWEFICPGAKNTQPQPIKAKVNKIVMNVQTLLKKKKIFDQFYISERYLWENLSDVMDYEFNQGPEVFTASE